MDEETRKKLEEWNSRVGAKSLGQGDVDSDPSQSQSQPSTKANTPLQNNPLNEARQQNIKNNKDLLSRIRTYESDAAEAVNKKKASVSSIFLAQQKAQAGSSIREAGGQTRPKRSRGVLYFLASMVLIAGGAGLLYGWYTFVYVPQQETVDVLENTSTLVPANKVDQFLFAVESRSDLAAALSSLRENSPVSPGEFYAVHFVEEEAGPEGEVVIRPVSSRVFLETLETNAPLPLYRSLKPEFTYGIHNSSGSSDENRPFIIMKTSFYQNAFASMLSWEESLPDDLDFMISVPQLTPEIDTIPPISAATSTDDIATTTESGTTTPMEEVEAPPAPLEFKDEVIKNHDARVLRDSNGHVMLLYSFADEETLVITNNTQTLERIFERLSLVEFE